MRLTQDCPMCSRVLYDLDSVPQSPELAKLRAENAQLRSIVNLVRRAVAETKVETADETDSLDIDHATRLLVLEALRRSGGNRTIAAELCGVARSTFFTYLKRFNIQDLDRRRKRRPEAQWVIEGSPVEACS